MQDKFFAQLEASLSSPRLSGYHHAHVLELPIDVLARYLWNIALCEALYPSLNCVEIGIRNSLNEAIAKKYQDAFWFDSQRAILHPRQANAVAEAEATLGPTLASNAGRIVAELSFGFWTAFFLPYYDRIFWPHLLRPVAPFLPKHARTRKALWQRFDRIRWLRNRVFHHEPIWRDANLRTHHAEIIEAIGWFSPALREVTILTDRLPQVLHEGPNPYRDKLHEWLKKHPAWGK